MARKHLKRLFAPKDWMMSKMTGVFAPRPAPGPHKLRECIPLLIVIRNRLKYALNRREAMMILRQGFVKVDCRKRTSTKFPAGFQDVIEIEKTGDRFRILYDINGRFSLTRIDPTEAHIKLCKVMNVFTSTRRIPMLTTHDGRRIRYPDPKIKRGDTVVVNVSTGRIVGMMRLRTGKVCMITGGANRGRVGEIVSIERHPGAFDIARMKDRQGHEFATRLVNVFVIASSYDTIKIKLPKMQGSKLSVIESRTNRLLRAEMLKDQQATKSRKIRA